MSTFSAIPEAPQDFDAFAGGLDAASEYVPVEPVGFMLGREDSALFQAVKLLLQDLKGKLKPTLRSPTREAYLESMVLNWKPMEETLSAINTVARLVEGVMVSAHDEKEVLCSAALELSGPSASEEVDFCLNTYAAARRLVERLQQKTDQSLLGDDLLADARLARQFRLHSELHEFGKIAILMAGDEDTSPSGPGIETSFELLRGGALRAYGAVREAIALREGNPALGDEPLEMDDEDRALVACG